MLRVSEPDEILIDEGARWRVGKHYRGADFEHGVPREWIVVADNGETIRTLFRMPGEGGSFETWDNLPGVNNPIPTHRWYERDLHEDELEIAMKWIVRLAAGIDA